MLVSRKWSNKTLTEHKQDRRTWGLEALGLPDERSIPTATSGDRSSPVIPTWPRSACGCSARSTDDSAGATT
ncbi:hypothetical protein ACFYYP_19490 [Microbispora rosea]|uniref:hypothetical protein n=1 Tax=Microbispora rosea TaxID=58117 RepID=UPI00367E7B7E